MTGSVRGREWGTALPQIIADLEGFERYAGVTTSYLLASSAMIPVIGKLGDVYGRKWFSVGGVVVFLIGIALCGAAWGMLERERAARASKTVIRPLAARGTNATS